MSNIEFRTPTAFLFFLASAGILYASAEEPTLLRPLAYSAFCFFTVLGPLGWIERSLVTTPSLAEQTNGTVPVADLLKDTSARWRSPNGS